MLIIVRLLLVIFSYLATILSAVYFGALYNFLTPESSGGTWIGAQSAWDWLIGYPLGLIFLLTLLLHAQGHKHVWWWNGIALVPAILFEMFLDPLHIYIPIVLALIAWGLGRFVNKALWKVAPGMMAKLGA